MLDVEAVVVAAGLSSRCERYKLALPLGDMTLIERSLVGMHACVARIVVVVGWRDEQVRSLLAHHEKVECVLNPDYLDGMFSSVRAGLAHTRAARVFFQPGDIPLVSDRVYRALLATAAPVAIPTYRGRKGHPVLLSREVVDAALAAPEEATLRDVIAAWGFEAVPVEDEAILWDVDTMADYERLVRIYDGGLAADEDGA